MMYAIWKVGKNRKITRAGKIAADNVPAALAAWCEDRAIGPDERRRYFARRAVDAPATQRRRREPTQPFTVTLTAPEKRAVELVIRDRVEHPEDGAPRPLRAALAKLQAAAQA